MDVVTNPALVGEHCRP